MKTFTSNKPSLKINWKGRRFEFKNGILQLEDTDLEQFSDFLKNGPSAGRNLVRTIDEGKAREIALRHRAASVPRAHQGPMTAASRAREVQDVRMQMEKEDALRTGARVQLTPEQIAAQAAGQVPETFNPEPEKGVAGVAIDDPNPGIEVTQVPIPQRNATAPAPAIPDAPQPIKVGF